MKHALLSGIALGVSCLVVLAARGAARDERSAPQAVAAQAASAPNVLNGRLEPLAVPAGLARAVEGATSKAAAAWVGYSVAAIGGDRGFGDGFSEAGCRTVYLEGHKTGARESRQTGPHAVTILLRVGGGAVQKIRFVGPDCDLDAGGLTVYWLAPVEPAESVALLSRYVKTEEGARTGGGSSATPGTPSWNSALSAIALHSTPDATRALERFVGGDRPVEVRKRAAFWLGSTQGAAGFAALRGYADADPDAAFRKELPFALSVSQEPGAVDAIIGMARHDTNLEVRRQAIFWLGQKAGEKVVGTLAEAARNDPETAIKERAVFALSRLPDGEGVEKLIEVARTNADPAVRKRAIFWLSRSDDPRALDYITKVVTGR